MQRRAVDVIVEVATEEDIAMIRGMLPLVPAVETIVLASLLYRLGARDAYGTIERTLRGVLTVQETSGVSPGDDTSSRALRALKLTGSARFSSLALQGDAHPDPWVRAVARDTYEHLGRQASEPSPMELLERAEERGSRDDNEGALELIEELLVLEPNHRRGLYLRCFLLKELDRIQEALDASRMALEVEPGNWLIQRLIGSLHWDAGHPDAALEAYDRAIRLQPTDPYVWYYKGYVLHRLARYQESLPCLDRALTLKPDAGFIMNQKGFCHTKLGQREEAIRAHREASRVAPRDLRTLEHLGQALQLASRPDEALQVFERVLRVDPTRQVALMERAMLHMDAQRWEAAVASFEAYVSVHDGSFRAWYDMGLCHRWLGQPVQAAQCFRRALRLVPESRKARSQLERCLRQLRKG